MSVINPGPHHILLLAQASSGLRDTSLNIEVAWTESKKDEGLGLSLTVEEAQAKSKKLKSVGLYLTFEEDLASSKFRDRPRPSSLLAFSLGLFKFQGEAQNLISSFFRPRPLQGSGIGPGPHHFFL